MSYCRQSTIGNGFLGNNLKLKKLDMSYCNQNTIRNGFLDKLTKL